jgi:hypothetical protein
LQGICIGHFLRASNGKWCAKANGKGPAKANTEKPAPRKEKNLAHLRSRASLRRGWAGIFVGFSTHYSINDALAARDVGEWHGSHHACAKENFLAWFAT